MENSPKYLYLASGVKNGEGFWTVGVKSCDENILEDKNLLDCHRKELIGNESAKDILFAINLNINNLINELRNKIYFFLGNNFPIFSCCKFSFFVLIFLSSSDSLLVLTA